MAKTVQFVDKKTNEDIYPVIDSSKIDKIQSFIDSSQFIRYNPSTDGTVRLEYKNNGYNHFLPLYVGDCYLYKNKSLTRLQDAIESSAIDTSFVELSKITLRYENAQFIYYPDSPSINPSVENIINKIIDKIKQIDASIK